MRKTKIIATIGPACWDPPVLRRLIDAGMNVARLNFSHGTIAEHVARMATLREIAAAAKQPLAILQDLGGTKLRLGELDEAYHLHEGDEVRFVADERSSLRGSLPFPHEDIFEQMTVGSTVYLADGTVALEVTAHATSGVVLRVQKGGIVSSHKGVNIPGLSENQPVMTRADRLAIKVGIEHQADWLAISFVRTPEDVQEVRKYVKELGGNLPIISKLERAAALEHLDGILKESDAVMVARGDLGIETPMQRLPILQKQIVRKANDLGKPCIVATQMLRSMLTAPTPTRAEISDIATAVLDGADAMMLSDETASGGYPVEAVTISDLTIRETETIYPFHRQMAAHDRTQAIAGAATALVEDTGSKLIVLTSSGRSAFEVARYRPRTDALVLAHNETAARKVCLGWGLTPLAVLPMERDVPTMVRMAIKAALASGHVSREDTVTIVHGFATGVPGSTSTVQVLDLKELP